MSRWYDRLLPRTLRPANGEEAARQERLETRVAATHQRIERLERKLAMYPEDEYAIRLRDALLGGRS
jgi:hypothetical protein